MRSEESFSWRCTSLVPSPATQPTPAAIRALGVADSHTNSSTASDPVSGSSPQYLHSTASTPCCNAFYWVAERRDDNGERCCIVESNKRSRAGKGQAHGNPGATIERRTLV